LIKTEINNSDTRTMLTSDMELTLDTYIVIPTSTGLPAGYKQTQVDYKSCA